jgi:predicted Zn-dependent peptidase
VFDGRADYSATVAGEDPAAFSLPHVEALTRDQKFDAETVAREAKIVLEELYLDKYKASMRQERAFDAALYGESHHHVGRTLDAQIATARLRHFRSASQRCTVDRRPRFLSR